MNEWGKVMKNLDTARQSDFHLTQISQTDADQILPNKQTIDSCKQLTNWENEGGRVDHERTGQTSKVTGSTSLICGKG